jgi:hypothetical protein
LRTNAKRGNSLVLFLWKLIPKAPTQDIGLL